VGSVVFLDHLDAGAAVLRDLINVCAYHKTQADVGVPQAVGRSGLSFPVFLDAFFAQDGVEELPGVFGKVRSVGCGLFLSTSLWKGFTAPLVLLQ
jgi:hypothetical protein